MHYIPTDKIKAYISTHLYLTNFQRQNSHSMNANSHSMNANFYPASSHHTAVHDALFENVQQFSQILQ